MVGVWDGMKLGWIPTDGPSSQSYPKIPMIRRCSTILPKHKLFQKHIHKLKFYPSADNFTQALLVILVTNIMSVVAQCEASSFLTTLSLLTFTLQYTWVMQRYLLLGAIRHCISS